MTVPDDAGKVRTAIRLGWTMAEVRGRNRPDPPPGANAALPGPPSRALPLHTEQTKTELRIEAQRVLGAMAHELALNKTRDGQPGWAETIDSKAEALYWARRGTAPPVARAAASGRAAPGGAAAGDAAAAAASAAAAPADGGAALADGGPVQADGGPVQADGGPVQADGGPVQADGGPADGGPADGGAVPADGGAAWADDGPADGGAVPADGGAAQADDGPADGGAVPADGGAAVPAAVGDRDKLWDQLQELIFKFDEHIQDTLAAGPDSIACGYQLGRALAEPYWALNPGLGDNEPSPEAWHFLLGKERCPEMGRLVGRLSRYFHEYTAAAVAGSVQIWRHVAQDPAWRRDDHLYLQVRRWYELVVMDQDPTTLVQPYALVRNFRTVLRALRIFWPELFGAVVAAAALSGFAVALGQNNISSLAKSALGFIAITGFSVAGLTARLKSQAQAMVTRLRQDVYTDLVAVAVTTAPPMPNVKRQSRQNTKLAGMARERKITPVTPN